MNQDKRFDRLQSLLIDLHYLIADIVNEVDFSLDRPEIDQSIFYKACVVDFATRHLILSIQSILYDTARDGQFKSAFGQVQ